MERTPDVKYSTVAKKRLAQQLLSRWYNMNGELASMDSILQRELQRTEGVGAPLAKVSACRAASQSFRTIHLVCVASAMHRFLWNVVLFFAVVGYAATDVTGSTDEATSAVGQSHWRRTSKGWERNLSWEASKTPPPTSAARLHPLVVATLLACVSIGSFVHIQTSMAL